MKNYLLLSLIACSAHSMMAEEKRLKPVDVEAIYEQNGEIVIETENGLRKIKVDDALKYSGSYNIKISEREFFDADQKIIRRALTVDERTKLHKLIYEANKKFQEKHLNDAWEIIEDALKIDPWNTKLINMKGSVLYLMGSPELAIVYWKKSLKIDPKQPQVMAMVTAEEEKIATKKQLPKAEEAVEGTASKKEPSQKDGRTKS